MGMPGSGHSLWPNAGVKKLQGDKDVMRKILDTRRPQRERQAHAKNAIKECENYI